MSSLNLAKHMTISAIIRCKTGTRIGGSKENIEIGGLDNPILRDPVSKLPYLPGSSLKGKMRALLEYKYDRVGWYVDRKENAIKRNIVKGEPCGCGQSLDKCPICTIFGPHKNPSHTPGPTRLILRDATLTEKSRKELEKLTEDGLQFAEIKTENIINRRTNTAGDPRQMERVPKGTEFDFNLSLRIFSNDDDRKTVTYLNEAFNLIQNDYLGGSGTRGYGWIEIKDVKIADPAFKSGEPVDINTWLNRK